MALSPRISGWRLPTAAALALLTAWAFAPGKARAECGDYLMVGGHAPAQKSAPVKPAEPCPCQGPHCSHLPSAPLLPPAPPPTIALVDWATFTDRLAAPADETSDLLADQSAARPSHHADPIFHPPRTQR